MIPTNITARDLPECWYLILNEIVSDIRSGNPKTKKLRVNKMDREVIRYEPDFLFGHIGFPGTRPLLPEVPPGIGIPTPVDHSYVDQYLSYYITDDRAPGEHYTYGTDLAWQIPWVIDHYKNLGVNRHCCMTVGRPESLLFYDDAVDYYESIRVFNRAKGTPVRDNEFSNEFNRESPGTSQCLRLVDTSVKDGKLHFSITSFFSLTKWIH